MTATRPRRGRPRDPEIETRVLDAVAAVYWETGWRAFTIDAVARRAGVGRVAVYRRWETKADLLVAALTRTAPLGEPIDTGSTVSDLEELARQLLDGYRSQAGQGALRVALDARVEPDLLASLTDTVNASRLLATRDIVRRGVDRGDLPDSVPTTLLLEMLTGSVLSHVLFAHTTDVAPTDDDAYARRLVATVLAAVG